MIAVIISLIVIKVGFVAPKTQTSVLKSMTEGIRFIRDREGLAAGNAGQTDPRDRGVLVRRVVRRLARSLRG
jgi:hypothetical protein